MGNMVIDLLLGRFVWMFVFVVLDVWYDGKGIVWLVLGRNLMWMGMVILLVF